MRFNKDYGDISRRSIRRDFQRPQYRECVKPKIDESPKPNAERRIAMVAEGSSYYKYRSIIVGKRIRLIEQSAISDGWICEFVHDEDRRALNKAADWSDSKKEYLFDNVKFKE